MIRLFLALVFGCLFVMIPNPFSYHIGVKKEGFGEVIEKKYHPPYYSLSYVGKTPMNKKIPESWKLTLKIEGLNKSVEVKKTLYDNIKEGQKLKCKYSINSISGKVYIKEIIHY